MRLNIRNARMNLPNTKRRGGIRKIHDMYSLWRSLSDDDRRNIAGAFEDDDTGLTRAVSENIALEDAPGWDIGGM